MNKLAPCIAEGIGTFALIFIGIGAINAANGDLLAVAFAHGLTIAVFASATMHISGGHLNPAVTFAALLGGKIDFNGALRYWASQLIGAAVAGATASRVSEFALGRSAPGPGETSLVWDGTHKSMRRREKPVVLA